MDLGGAKHIQTVYKRLKQKDYLQRDLPEIEKYEQEVLHREDLPLARKVARKALKNKEMNEKEKFPYVKLVYDKAYGETHRNVSTPGVSIESIQIASVNILADIRSPGGAEWW